MKHATHKVLNAAYMYYYATDAAFDENDEYFRTTYDDDDEGDETAQNGGPGPSASTSLASTRTAAQQKIRLAERLNALVGDVMVEAKAVRFAFSLFSDFCTS